ncbi:hypothetical protein, partial [Dubosiella newyorkensis]
YFTLSNCKEERKMELVFIGDSLKTNIVNVVCQYIFSKKCPLLYIKNPNYRCNRKKMIDDFSEIVFALFDSEN